MKILIRHIGLGLLLFAGAFSVKAQTAINPSDIQLLGTRSWIRINWDATKDVEQYQIYYATENKKPAQSAITLNTGAKQFYIQNVQPNTKYHVWVDGVSKGKIKEVFNGTAITQKKWVIDPKELKELESNPSSAALREVGCFTDIFNFISFFLESEYDIFIRLNN